jgi:hypothetical protein
LQKAWVALSLAQRHGLAMWASGRWAKNGLPRRLVLATVGAPQQAMRMAAAAVRVRRFSSVHSTPVSSQTWTSRPSTSARSGIGTSWARDG